MNPIVDMFVPFEKVYDYLNQYVHENTIIYRFYPHENRKISSIDEVNIKSRDLETWIQRKYKVLMLIHDQEPLGLDRYDKLNIEELRGLLKKYSPELVHLTEEIFPTVQDLGPMIFNIIRYSVYDKMLITHSELDSPDLKKYEMLGTIGVYWWSHALIARDWFRYAAVDPSLDYRVENFQFDFNVYNRDWEGTREYRLKFTDLVLQHRLEKHCKIKFSPVPNSIHYSQHSFKNVRFRPESDLDVLEINTADASSSADYSSADYNECAIDVVLETLFDDPRKHLTEKTLRPIACGKPFVLVSTAGSLDYLRSYGFNTFSDVIDESYDTISDPVERLSAVIKLMKHISNLPINDKQELFARMHRIAEENKIKFWSRRFPEKIVNEFVRNYRDSYNELQRYKQGKNWIDFRKKIFSLDPTVNLTTDSALRSRQDILTVHKEIQQNRKRLI